MPRARISVNGIEIAKQGYDVDTAAPENMVFSSSLVAMRLARTGVVTPAPYDGELSTVYYRHIEYYPTPFLQAPVVLVAGINADGSSDQAPYVMSGASDEGGSAWWLPYYSVYSYANRFELYVYQDEVVYVGSPNWRYFVFQNTLSA